MEQVFSLLDNEFVQSRGRLLSLKHRFPHVLRPSSILAALQGNKIASLIAVRYFRWVTPDATWKGSMIGFVYTRPDHRGRGLASLLMETVRRDMVRDSTDFGVLWTTIPEFYARMGWISRDNGLFGRSLAVMRKAPSSSESSLLKMDAAVVEHVEKLRHAWIPERLERSLADYNCIPLPATSVATCLIEGHESGAYAIVGNIGKAAYVYEIVGHPATFGDLWGFIRARYEQVYVNSLRGSPLVQALGSGGDVEWEPQRLTMWLPLSERAARSATWYIPYFDRI
jgi:predicted N-acetyltransferase YhbS